jgi:hypothetical protein
MTDSSLTYDIHFDDATHTYTVTAYLDDVILWVEVKRSVTQIMRDAGLLGDYDGIPQHYMDRGTRVHDACELVAQGWITSSDVESDIKVYIESFESIVEALGLSYVDSETPCYYAEYQCDKCGKVIPHDELTGLGECPHCWGSVTLLYDYAGKFDLIVMWEGRKTLVELKTTKVDMFHGIQIAAYERMVDVDDVLGIELKTGYVFGKADDWQKNHDAWRDINTGFFDLESWKSDRKRRRMKRIL